MFVMGVVSRWGVDGGCTVSGMAVKSEVVTLSGSAVLIAEGRGSSDTKQVVVRPEADIHVGGSDVTSGNGMPVNSGESLALFLGVGDTLYATGTGSVRVVQTRF